jgi:hypothetical protein
MLVEIQTNALQNDSKPSPNQEDLKAERILQRYKTTSATSKGKIN